MMPLPPFGKIRGVAAAENEGSAHGAMIPAGYMAKRVAATPAWLPVERVSSVYSVSGCISEDFADYIRFWQHNGYWLFNSPETIVAVAREQAIDLGDAVLFFYEVQDRQFDAGAWTPFAPEPSFRTDVHVPPVKVLEGYDVVSFTARTSPECSPLSCNALASEVDTNPRCLLTSLEQARTLLEHGVFKNAEPGPYRIFAVYSVPWPGGV